MRRADGKRVVLNIGPLAVAGLMPFSCALIGEHGRELLSQVIYSSNMTGLAVMALLTARYIQGHPESALMAMPSVVYRDTRVRLLGRVLVGLVAVGLNDLVPSLGNMASMLMAVIMPLSRRAERASGPSVPDHAPG